MLSGATLPAESNLRVEGAEAVLMGEAVACLR